MTKRDLKQMTYGIVIGLVLAACAGAQYQYYSLDLPAQCYQEGKLLGHAAQEDQPLSACAPTDQNKMPCAVFKEEEKTRLMTDLEQCQADLKLCQQPPARLLLESR